MKEKLFNLWKRFLTWFGDIYFATQPPLCKAKQIERMMEVIKTGDVICRGYTYYLDGYFIPGEYTHSGIVINERGMVHSIAEGVGYIHPIDFVKDTDRFVIIRPRYKNNNEQQAIERAIWHSDCNNTQYDFTFSDPNKFYCHEFTVDCLNRAKIYPKTSKITFGIGMFKYTKSIYTAKDIISVGSIVYEFKGEINEKI